MVVRDDFKHLHHTVMQPLRYASRLRGDGIKHCTRCTNSPISNGSASVGDEVKHLWYLGDDNKYRSQTAPALKWVNTRNCRRLPTVRRRKPLKAPANVGDYVTYPRQARVQPELCAPRSSRTRVSSSTFFGYEVEYLRQAPMHLERPSQKPSCLTIYFHRT